MDVKDLKKIVSLMNENHLVEIEIEEQGYRLRLRKAEGVGGGASLTVVPAAMPAVAATAAASPAGAEGAAPDSAEGLQTIAAPMVGTFYSSPSPDAESYASVGSRVTPESVVCILEAMKVMNEIKAECSGEIVKVCVQNGEAVEYGQALFLVRPA
jgi:acetyl-CoA carboxylase biotin carboxyl carrier protein